MSLFGVGRVTFWCIWLCAYNWNILDLEEHMWERWHRLVGYYFVCVCVWALTEQKQVLINPAWNELWVQNLPNAQHAGHTWHVANRIWWQFACFIYIHIGIINPKLTFIRPWHLQMLILSTMKSLLLLTIQYIKHQISSDWLTVVQCFSLSSHGGRLATF